MNKRGFELSINFVVTLILAIVILSFGIYFVKMIYERSTELKLVLDQQTNMELERLMDSGEKVSLYPGTREVSSGEMATFGLGVLNVAGNEPNKEYRTFKITIEFDEAYDENKNELDKEPDLKIITAEGEYNSLIEKRIENNKKEKILVGILLQGAKKGTYVFDVNVTINGNQYGDLKKIYVKVY